MSPSTRRRSSAGTALLASTALVLAACGSGDSNGDGGANGAEAPAEEVDVEALLEEGGELTIWGWSQPYENAAAQAEDEYPNLDIEVVNVGTGEEHYTAMQNAVTAGSGGPDLAQVEQFAVPQFVLGEALADLGQFGAGELQDTFNPGPWDAVTEDGGVYALPTDSGPLALFYNEAVFDEHGIEVPTTWEEWGEAGRTLQAADPEVYITNDIGDAGLMTSLMWQAGGQPFQVDGTEAVIDVAGEGSTTAVEFWNSMVAEELLAPIPGWSDEWYQALSDGTIATLVTGAWMRGSLESGVEAGHGDWRVAPPPQWEEDGATSAENGGSAMAVMADSQNQELAYAFAHYTAVGAGLDAIVETAAFPANAERMQEEDFIGREFEYFGGQQVNEVFAESAANVVEGWQFLPYHLYATSIYADHVGEAHTSDLTITEGLASWEEALVSYGNDQGFTVSSP